tara:strand:+ start:215 stop:859 length:645 start_codon:yes stop_codon:yes gene_type:complete
MIISDVFVILDDAEYSKNCFINRNKIKTPQGWTWLSLPVQFKQGQLINQVKLASNIKWDIKHWKAIENSYSKYPFFDKYAHYFKTIYNKKSISLSELNTEIIKIIIKILDIDTEIIISSDLNIKTKNVQRLIDICNKLNGTTYIAGGLSKNYLDEDLFKKNNIKLVYQDYIHPTYTQRFGNFEPYMSIIDLIFNYGPDTQKILLKNNLKKQDLK